VAAQAAQAARFGKLVGSNAVSRQEFDNAVASRGQAVADVAAGKASVRSARINLGYTDVVAPITGRAGISAVTEGAYVQGGSATLMTTIQQIDPIYVDLAQSSVQGLRLRLRQDLAGGKVHSAGPNRARVTVLLEDGTRYPLPGTVQFSDVNVDPGTGSVTVRTLVPNPQHVLLPGMFVRGQVEAGVLEDALLVPQAGVAHDAQGQATRKAMGQIGGALVGVATVLSAVRAGGLFGGYQGAMVIPVNPPPIPELGTATRCMRSRSTAKRPARWDWR